MIVVEDCESEISIIEIQLERSSPKFTELMCQTIDFRLKNVQTL